MKKTFLLFGLLVAITQSLFAQTRIIGPAEKKLADTICDCLVHKDLLKVTNKEEAVAFYTDCINQHSDLLIALSEEQNADMTDLEAMKKLGINLALTLMKNQCPGFVQLSKFMAEKEISNNNNVNSSTTGILKRIDNKGFNYLVINNNGAEKSFLWLRQFAGSEKLINGITTSIGKKVTIKWQEIEVYLPVAKGYYKVKEITDVTFL
ncbi:MAG: hypothetical protein ABIN91_07325 [Mucilaginibacter sp.]|uniref:hypothetical protein n=1 Tax=Mucilaginibacter sp. TaxID=1882438 RepID=UPI003264B13D